MKQVGTYQRKKSYFTKSQATLPVSHPRQQFLSIIKAKKEYQSLIKKQLESLEMYENEEKVEVSKFERQLQTKDAFIRPFIAQQTIKEEKSQEEFRMCFKQLQHIKIMKEFQRFVKKMNILQQKRRNMMGAKYYYENSQRKKCMQLWIGVWKRSKFERQQKIKAEREREREQIVKKTQIIRRQQEQIRKVKEQKIKQEEQKLKTMLNEKAINLQQIEKQLKNENERLSQEKSKAQSLMQQIQRKKNQFIKWQQAIAIKQQILNKKQQQMNLKIVSNVFSASELHLDSLIADISRPSIQLQQKQAIIKPFQVEKRAKEQKSEEDFRICSQKLQHIKKQREFMKFINKIKMVKKAKQKMVRATWFYRNYLIERYMAKWVQTWKKAKRQIQQQKERHLKQMEAKMQILIKKQEQARVQDEKVKNILSERAKQLQKVSIQLKSNNERLNQEMKKTLMMMQQMERKRADLTKQQDEIARKKQILNKRQVQINQKLIFNELIKINSDQKKVKLSNLQRQLQVEKADIVPKITEQPKKEEKGQEEFRMCCKQLQHRKIKNQFYKFVNKLRVFKETQTRNIEAKHFYEQSLKKKYILTWVDVLRRLKTERQQKIRVQMERERIQIQEKIENARKQQEERRKLEQQRQKLEEEKRKYEEEQIRVTLDEKAKNLQIIELQLKNGNEKLSQERKRTQSLMQQMEKKQNQLAKREYEIAIKQQLLNKNSAFRFFQINPSFLASPLISNKSHNQRSQVSSPQTNKHQFDFPPENVFQINHISPEQSNHEDSDQEIGFSPQQPSKGSIYDQSPHQSKGQYANLQQLLEYQEFQQHQTDQIEQRHIDLSPLDQQLDQQKDASDQEQSDQIQNYMQDKYNRSLKRKAFKGLLSNNQQNYYHNLSVKCFNGLKIYYQQKKMLRKYLQLQQQASEQAYSFYPTTFEQKLQFQQLINN